jgi:fructokinase
VSREKDAVAVFGEMLVDEFPDRTRLGGAPFNVAYHLGRLGLGPVLVTRLGLDAEGERLVRAMEDAGLDTRGVQRDPLHATGRVRVVTGEGGHRFEILPERAYDFVDAGAAAAVARALDLGLVYFGTLAQRHPQSRAALEALLAASECPRWLDINLREPWYDAETVERSLAAADHVKLNDGELETVSEMLGIHGGDDQSRAVRVVDRYGLRSVVVTCGERGAWTLHADGRYARVEGRPLGGALADTVGAGDAFAAVSILGLLRGWQPKTTLERADAFARAICLVHGAIPPDPSIYDAVTQDRRPR